MIVDPSAWGRTVYGRTEDGEQIKLSGLADVKISAEPLLLETREGIYTVVHKHFTRQETINRLTNRRNN